MQLLLVSDLHYTLPQFDWVYEQAADFDVVVFAGDSLDLASAVALESQIVVIRTYLRKVEEAIATGDQAAATAALRAAQPEMDRGVTKGVLHKNTVARKMSRLASRVKALGANA